MDSAKLGGVILRVQGALRWVPAADALELAAVPPITRVPGGPEGLLGLALHEGEVVPVVTVGDDRDAMLVCSHAGAVFGVVGGVAVATGMFERSPGGEGVLYEGETATTLDVASLCARTSPPSWGGRWPG